MVRLFLAHQSIRGNEFGNIPLAIGIFLSISALVALCAKHRATREQATKETTSDSKSAPTAPLHIKETISSYMKFSPSSSPLSSPRKLIATISNKAHMIPFPYKKRSSEPEEDEMQKEGGYGGEGVWQKNILLGEKCQPLQFSGALFYDNYGNPVKEMPRSPRARLSPLPSFPSPAAKSNLTRCSTVE